MTKFERVVKLLDRGTLTTRQIAEIVECSESYVRFARNRKRSVPARNRDCRLRYYTNAKDPNIREAAKAASRAAYAEKRKAGASIEAACSAASTAYSRIMHGVRNPRVT